MVGKKFRLVAMQKGPIPLIIIENICKDFIELHGDRNVKDDKAIVGGFARIGTQPVMIPWTSKRTKYQTTPNA